MNFTFIDLFAGIGGFHIALSKLGGECVFASEIDPKARITYQANHKVKNFAGDITKVDINNQIPQHDILCGGFPCQPFSQAGFKKGFKDGRGLLFWYIKDIIKDKKPKAFFLENVRHLKKHDEGRTFQLIKSNLEEIGYSFYDFIVYAKDYGLPQLRPRLFMIGLKDRKEFSPPPRQDLSLTMSDVFGGSCKREVGFTLRVGGRSSGINSRHNWDSYIVNNQIVKLKPKHALKMQGFPEDFKLPVSEKEAMKQLGNSVAISAVEAYTESILQAIR